MFQSGLFIRPGVSGTIGDVTTKHLIADIEKFASHRPHFVEVIELVLKTTSCCFYLAKFKKQACALPILLLRAGWH